MIIRLRRRFRFLQVYAAFSFGLIVFLSIAAFTQPRGTQRIDELTVERLNVVDGNGTLRLVIANKDRMHPGVMDGITIDRPRPVAGIIFFNDEGDEVGGLAFTGTDDGGRSASALLAFDQLKQDQTVALSYREGDGQRSAGLTVWDRSELPLTGTIRALNAANAHPPGPERDRAVQAARAAAPPAPRRLFAGKDTDRSAMVSLSDANGKPRLVMKVEADGSASIEFLDADGRTVQRIPAP